MSILQLSGVILRFFCQSRDVVAVNGSRQAPEAALTTRSREVRMKKIICFGDTITEMGIVTESRGYAARLAERYVRRADVLVRGFSGYTTREALTIVDSVVLAEHPACVIMQFGLHDSVLPNQFLHVPVEEYHANLEELVSRIACFGAWLVLVTPPPVDERRTRTRTQEHTGAYVSACLHVGVDMNVPVVNLFRLISHYNHWETRCLSDGVHLTATGMDILYDALIPELDQQIPLQALPRQGVPGIV